MFASRQKPEAVPEMDYKLRPTLRFRINSAPVPLLGRAHATGKFIHNFLSLPKRSTERCLAEHIQAEKGLLQTSGIVTIAADTVKKAKTEVPEIFICL
ncbi:hypothetical protein ACOBR2_08075 [Telmatobacter bradus]|uniref:hypothetical protein n=1 Tax=Telmatobacter bradus TaxID=474953 RepID=UPI003B43C210